jgi:hypothetical protein
LEGGNLRNGNGSSSKHRPDDYEKIDLHTNKDINSPPKSPNVHGGCLVGRSCLTKREVFEILVEKCHLSSETMGHAERGQGGYQ